MPGHIYLCFVWHMHQPFYKDLVSGEYKLPWTRMHALKDYYGMVKILEDFPAIHQTFNLVPSMLSQIEEYAAGTAADPFLRVAQKPSEELTQADKEFALRYFFQANEQHVIDRYPRYAELLRALRKMNNNTQLAAQRFDNQMFRDLQVLSQLAWFDEEYLRNDAEIAALVARRQGYSRENQALLTRKQRQACANVIPVYDEFARRGQIELSTTPFYHPILPLLCDSNIAGVAHPYVPLPATFSYPRDAEIQLERAVEYFVRLFETQPAGFWPSEGSVSDQVLGIAADRGFRWIATDNGILARTLSTSADPFLSYQPFLWKQGSKSIHVLFRDHYLSDLIGFVYSRLEARTAAAHFLNEIHTNCASILQAGRDAVVPIILDGENAWEYYQQSGRPFLKELYAGISGDSKISAVTVSEAIERVPAYQLNRIFPGSWINANFDVWIGAEEDNQAWEYLLAARQTYDRVLASPKGAALSALNLEMAWEEILIAEGSDWCWWYGPEHSSANRPEFDQLYRDHLANVYRLLEEPVPTELSKPILKTAAIGQHEQPSGAIKAAIDGVVTSYFEWMGAGLYRIDSRSGAMHSQRPLIQDLRYGTDGRHIYLRLDFAEPVLDRHEIEFRLSLRNSAGSRFRAVHRWRNERLELEDTNLENGAVCAAVDSIYEASLLMCALEVRQGDPVWLSVAIFRDGLPVAALPINGELEVDTREPSAWVS
jgi:alpha-amylase/alpha-mannosidase (GH57 family)